MKAMRTLREMRWPLALLLGAVALSLAAWFVHMREEARIERLRDEIHAMQSQLEAQLAKERLGRQVQGAFETLARAGFLDPVAARTVWVEDIARSLGEARVLKAGLSLQPPVAVGDSVLEGLGYRLQVVPVTVSMQLAHEGDLAAFLRDVLQDPVGIVMNRHCSVASVQEGGEPTYQGANLQARCRFDWYALEPAPAAGELDPDDMDLDADGV